MTGLLTRKLKKKLSLSLSGLFLSTALTCPPPRRRKPLTGAMPSGPLSWSPPSTAC